MCHGMHSSALFQEVCPTSGSAANNKAFAETLQARAQPQPRAVAASPKVSVDRAPWRTFADVGSL